MIPHAWGVWAGTCTFLLRKRSWLSEIVGLQWFLMSQMYPCLKPDCPLPPSSSGTLEADNRPYLIILSILSSWSLYEVHTPPDGSTLHFENRLSGACEWRHTAREDWKTVHAVRCVRSPWSELQSFSGILCVFTAVSSMVFLTFPCLIRNRGPDRYWRIQEVLKNARVRWLRCFCSFFA